MSEERIKVLDLLSQGKINAMEAAEILQAISNAPKAEKAAEVEVESEEVESVAEAKAAEKAKMKVKVKEIKVEKEEAPKAKSSNGRRQLRIQVTANNANEPQVNIAIPFGFVEIGEQLLPALKKINWDDFAVNVGEDSDRVRIFVE